MLFSVDTGAPHSCIGNKALERTFHHSERIFISVIGSKRDFKFSETEERWRGMVEPLLPTPGSTLDISVILDVVDVEIPPMLGLDILDRNSLLFDHVTNHLWNCIITNKDPLRFEDIWKVKLTRMGGYLYVRLSTSIQQFDTIAQARKQFK